MSWFFISPVSSSVNNLAANFLPNSTPHHNKLLSNYIGQTEALLNGKNINEVQDELIKSGTSNDKLNEIAPFKVFDTCRLNVTIPYKTL